VRRIQILQNDEFKELEFVMRKFIVNLSSRLGALGFLNAGNKYARGNQGMKDQVMALKWIQDNIGYFGGDPKSVTLFGQVKNNNDEGMLVSCQYYYFIMVKHFFRVLEE
jgi:hypothetical protein